MRRMCLAIMPILAPWQSNLGLDAQLGAFKLVVG